jgi:adenylosuccinate lyase
MGRIWSDQNKFQRWLDVELATAEAEAEMGMIPAEAARALREKSAFSVERILEIEKQVKHDVIAFTTNVAESVGAEARYLHYGLTSNDVVDTAQALQIRDASAILLKGVERLSEVLKKRAHEFKHTPMMGRTHGIHAEAITLGCKIAIWYVESQRNLERLKFAAEQLRVGKISGAVGMYGHSTPELEERICAKLGLAPAPITSQVISRDRHAHYVCTLAVIGASLEKIALEVRGLQRTEVREVEEYFAPGQKGSSAMPHKRNPVTSEQICGLARVVRANAQAALENVALWHERDISHSSVERVILPDSTILADYLLEKTTKLVETMFVYPERMMENLNQMKGLIYSGQLLLDLVQKGAAREDAYRWVQRNAMKVWESREDFKTLVEHDEDICRFISTEEIASVFNVHRYLTHVDAMFKRVFGE